MESFCFGRLSPAMKKITSLCGLIIACIGFLGFAPATGHAQVVINEFAYDDTGDDDEEFVELFNAGGAEVDLTDWSLLTGDDTGSGPKYAIPEETTIQPGATLVLGSPNVPEVDVVFEAQDLFGNGPGYLVLWQADGEFADHVVYEGNKDLGSMPVEATVEGMIWGNHVLVSSSKMSWQRWFDGRDTQRNDVDFGHLPWTPGASNNRTDLPDFASDFEDSVPEEDETMLPGSFVPGRIIDPAMVSPSNPNAIPASPDGGMALVVWDPEGGGNFAVLDARPVSDMTFEAWVYFDATPEAAGESETWSIGLRGTSGAYFNIPVLYDANGNTGVTWTYQVTSTEATLYLIDEGHGRPAAERKHLGEIQIVPGENDGWQRLRLEVRGMRAEGIFGGTFESTDDGLKIEGTVDEMGIGNFYIGYREAITDITSARPPTIDALTVAPPESGEPRFSRGDANADGDMNLTDAISILNFLFTGGVKPPCTKSGDSDDNGALQLTDAVRILNFLFLGGPPPDDPYPDCGSDETADDLDCISFPPCF